MALAVLENDKTTNETENKKFHYDKDTLKMQKIGRKTFWTCEIVADRDIEVEYSLGLIKYKNVIPKGARGGRVWVDYKALGNKNFDFNGGLSQEGNCWVGPDCLVGFGSLVNGDAIIVNKSTIFNVKVSDRAVVNKSDVFCVNSETSAIINDSKVSHSKVKVADLNMRDHAQLLNNTRVEKRADCVYGGLSMQDESILNHCVVKSTQNEHISVSGKSVHTDKTIEGFGASYGDNVTVSRNIVD